MVNLVVGAIVVAIVGAASRYLWVQKKKGVKCIGCPCSGGSCHCKR